jgi:hypothetical protein
MSSNGFIIVAFNNSSTDYVKLAGVLTDSIHRSMPRAKVCLLTDSDVVDARYDHVVRIESVDNSDWKLSNDWLVYEHSPYDRTIKLEADMYVPRNIDYWWNILKDRDLNICTTIRDFRGNISDNVTYRKTFTESHLPQTYNAITYFRKSALAEEFFKVVKDIFENWREYSSLLKLSTEDRATTDVVYAIAAKSFGVEYCTMPTFTDFSMAHMKRDVNNLQSNVWYEELVYEVLPDVVRFNTYPQMYPIHYHNKEFADIIIQEMSDE